MIFKILNVVTLLGALAILSPAKEHVRNLVAGAFLPKIPCYTAVIVYHHGLPQGWKGGSFPPETEKNVVEIGYFRELYKMTEVQGDGIENG